MTNPLWHSKTAFCWNNKNIIKNISITFEKWPWDCFYKVLTFLEIPVINIVFYLVFIVHVFLVIFYFIQSIVIVVFKQIWQKQIIWNVARTEGTTMLRATSPNPKNMPLVQNDISMRLRRKKLLIGTTEKMVPFLAIASKKVQNKNLAQQSICAIHPIYYLLQFSQKIFKIYDKELKAVFISLGFHIFDISKPFMKL